MGERGLGIKREQESMWYGYTTDGTDGTPMKRFWERAMSLSHSCTISRPSQLLKAKTEWPLSCCAEQDRGKVQMFLHWLSSVNNIPNILVHDTCQHQKSDANGFERESSINFLLGLLINLPLTVLESSNAQITIRMRMQQTISSKRRMKHWFGTYRTPFSAALM